MSPVATRSVRSRRNHGIAAVELAVALPLLVLVLVGVTEGGRALSEGALLTRGVELGARYAAEHATVGSTGVVILSPELVTATQNLVVSGSIGAGTPILPGLQVSSVTLTSPTTSTIEVAAHYLYKPIFHREPLPLGASGSDFGLTLNAQTRMQVMP